MEKQSSTRQEKNCMGDEGIITVARGAQKVMMDFCGTDSVG
jgi:hypothetical protein